MKKILILNGPNLNLLGKREPEIYGSEGFESYFESMNSKFSDLSLEYFQSNHEGAIIDKLHECGFDELYQGIVLNAGAYTHTSIAIGDAVAGISTPVVEVHISNVFARAAYRHHSYISVNAVGVIVGLGLKGYELAINFFEKQ